MKELRIFGCVMLVNVLFMFTTVNIMHSKCYSTTPSSSPRTQHKNKYIKEKSTHFHPNKYNLTKDRIVIGLPTVRRSQENYLIPTLNSLITRLRPKERKICSIVVFIAESNATNVQLIKSEVEQAFLEETKQNLITIVVAPDNLYPEDWKDVFWEYQGTKDSIPDYLIWRTKQTMDYIYLMKYVKSHFNDSSTYYLQLEDDIRAKNYYFSMIQSFAKDQTGPWQIISFSEVGFIGKLFRIQWLHKFYEYMELFYTSAPCDWLLLNYVRTLACGIDFGSERCETESMKYRIRYKPQLFKHLGKFSSKEGTIRKIH